MSNWMTDKSIQINIYKKAPPKVVGIVKGKWVPFFDHTYPWHISNRYHSFGSGCFLFGNAQLFIIRRTLYWLNLWKWTRDDIVEFASEWLLTPLNGPWVQCAGREFSAKIAHQHIGVDITTRVISVFRQSVQIDPVIFICKETWLTIIAELDKM